MKKYSQRIPGFPLLAAAVCLIVPSLAHAAAHAPVPGNSSVESGAKADPALAASRLTTVVFRFAVESQAAPAPSGFSAQACPQTGALDGSVVLPSSPAGVTADAKVLDIISLELQRKLSKKTSVMVNPDPAAVPVGALAIGGCITRATGGNGAARLVGMNLGASHLSVHVLALTRTRDGWRPVDSFDVSVKGGDLLPPLGPAGLAVHAARDPHQTLSGDAKKLADRVLKKLAQDRRAREQAPKTS